MDEYFSKFGLDIRLLCRESGQSFDQLIPTDFDELRWQHICDLMEMEEIGTQYMSILKSMLTPKELLNDKDHLRSKIWRYVEYKSQSESLENAISRAMILREPQDVLYDEDASLVICQPKMHPGAFRGVSCFLSFPLPIHALLQTLYSFPSKRDLSEIIEGIKAQSGVSVVRCVVGLYLDIDDRVPNEDWIVDADDINPGHVTITVANVNGLPAEAPTTMTRKVRVPALEALSWKREPQLLVLKAEAEWRDDFLPNDDKWSNVVYVLNLILKYGDMDDFLAVWRIHELMHSNVVGVCGADIHLDTANLFKRILVVLKSFEMSDQHDINDSAPHLYRAIADMRTIVSLAEIS